MFNGSIDHLGDLRTQKETENVYEYDSLVKMFGTFNDGLEVVPAPLASTGDEGHVIQEAPLPEAPSRETESRYHEGLGALESRQRSHSPPRYPNVGLWPRDG